MSQNSSKSGLKSSYFKIQAILYNFVEGSNSIKRHVHAQNSKLRVERQSASIVRRSFINSP